MTPQTILHLGGNGHSSARLDLARKSLTDLGCPITLVDLPYPGFEGRPRSSSRDDFLQQLGSLCLAVEPSPIGAIASGIGGLIALGLRARGVLPCPLVLQAPVLWGLETRRFPQVMRLFPPARRALHAAFSFPPFQKRFARKHFLKPLPPRLLQAFFDGYRQCSSFSDFFVWFDPTFLRELERDFASQPSRLENITVWWGGHDAILGPAELERTEMALGCRWPSRTFPAWGHYPTLDDPAGWCAAIASHFARWSDSPPPTDFPHAAA